MLLPYAEFRMQDGVLTAALAAPAVVAVVVDVVVRRIRRTRPVTLDEDASAAAAVSAPAA